MALRGAPGSQSPTVARGKVVVSAEHRCLRNNCILHVSTELLCVAPSSGNRYRIDDTDSEDDAVDGGDTNLEEEESDDEVAVRRKPKRVRPYILNEQTCKTNFMVKFHCMCVVID